MQGEVVNYGPETISQSYDYSSDENIIRLIAGLSSAGFVLLMACFVSCWCACSRRGRDSFMFAVRRFYRCCCIRLDCVSKMDMVEAISRYEEDPPPYPKEFVQSVITNRLIVAVLETLNQALPDFFFSVLPTGSLRERFGKRMPSTAVLASDYDLMLIPDAVTVGDYNESGADKTVVFSAVEDPQKSPETPSGYLWLKLEDKYLQQWEKLCLRRHFMNEGCSFLSSTNVMKLVSSAIEGSPKVAQVARYEAMAHQDASNIKDPSILAEQVGPALKFKAWGRSRTKCCGGSISDDAPISIFEADFTLGIHCSFWPRKAAGWFSSERRKYWPSPEVVSKINSLKCHVVPKRSTETLVKLTLEQVESEHASWGQSPGLEWRYSFSQAELLLADVLPEAARTAYLAFKAVVKRHINACGPKLSSFALKCIMFRCVEETPPSFWEDGPMVAEPFFTFLIDVLDKALQHRCIGNYWIPEINLLSDLSEDECVMIRIIMRKIKISPKAYVADNWMEHTRCIRLNCCYCGPPSIDWKGDLRSRNWVIPREEAPCCICCAPKVTYKSGLCCDTRCPYDKISVEVY